MALTRRQRGALVVGGIIALLIGSEVALNLYHGPNALVVVENLGPEPIDELKVINGSETVLVRKIPSGAKTRLDLNGKGPNILRFEFRQRGNGMTSYELPGFDAREMNQEGFKLRLRFRTNEVERFQEEAGPATPLGRAARDLWKWINDQLESESSL